MPPIFLLTCQPPLFTGPKTWTKCESGISKISPLIFDLDPQSRSAGLILDKQATITLKPHILKTWTSCQIKDQPSCCPIQMTRDHLLNCTSGVGAAAISFMGCCHPLKMDRLNKGPLHEIWAQDTWFSGLKMTYFERSQSSEKTPEIDQWPLIELNRSNSSRSSCPHFTRCCHPLSMDDPQ